MKKFGVLSCNRYCNFTNYGSALQSWALCTAINKMGNGKWQAILIDYCPDSHLNLDPLNPIENMWDADEESIKMCELSLPAIKINFYKFEDFYNNRFVNTEMSYTSDNFDEIINEKIDGYVCGSDTIFCIDEFGLDDGYYSNYEPMKNGYSVAYAASLGDSNFNEKSLSEFKKLIKNFDYIALRESFMLDYINDNTVVPVKRVLDPTLLLSSEDYDIITSPRLETDKYLLLYARRYDEEMFKLADELAEKNGWKIIDISLRANNADKHKMFYDAGVEEFLSLVKNAEFVITNSFHGAIFSVQFKKQFFVFSREQANNKIVELLDSIGLSERLIHTKNNIKEYEIDYDEVHETISVERKKSLDILEEELNNCR